MPHVYGDYSRVTNGLVIINRFYNSLNIFRYVPCSGPNTTGGNVLSTMYSVHYFRTSWTLLTRKLLYTVCITQHIPLIVDFFCE